MTVFEKLMGINCLINKNKSSRLGKVFGKSSLEVA